MPGLPLGNRTKSEGRTGKGKIGSGCGHHLDDKQLDHDRLPAAGDLQEPSRSRVQKPACGSVERTGRREAPDGQLKGGDRKAPGRERDAPRTRFRPQAEADRYAMGLL